MFVLTKKNNYANVALEMMDSLHSKIIIKQLQMVRINRTVPLCYGTDQQGAPMSNGALDVAIELIQK